MPGVTYLIKLGSPNKSFQYLKGTINSYPTDGVQPLQVSLCQPVQDPGAGEDQDPAIWLPWILIIPHNKTVASSVPAEPGMEQVKLDRHNNVFVRDGFSENKGH